MIKIDLHGVKHEKAADIIFEACSKYETPFIIITGNSTGMKQIVKSTLSHLGLKAENCLGNSGRLIVYESR